MRLPRQRIRDSLFLAIALCAAIAPRALAHETRPAYLEIKETSPEHYDILWRTPVNAGMRLPIVLQLPKDARNLSAPTLQELTDSLVERRVIELKGGLAGKRIEFVGLQASITDVLVRVEMSDGRKSTTIVHPSQSWFEMAASQNRWAVAGAFIVQGIRHIFLGADHLLFLLGLLLIVKNRWMLLKTVTAFTVAHSITLAIATLGYANAPVIPLNAAIALSILFLGPEIVRVWRGETDFLLSVIRGSWRLRLVYCTDSALRVRSPARDCREQSFPLRSSLSISVWRSANSVSFCWSCCLNDRSASCRYDGRIGCKRCQATRWGRWERSGPYSALRSFWEL